jgi:hypothetical protein
MQTEGVHGLHSSTVGLCRLRIFDLPLDVLEARSLGNANELALEGIATAADTITPALTVQVCYLFGMLSRHTGHTSNAVTLHLAPEIASRCTP